MLEPGDPHALGAQRAPGGVRVAVWAPDAAAVHLVVFDATGQAEQARHALNPGPGGVWHGVLPWPADAPLVYGLDAGAGPMLDPYARRVLAGKALLAATADAVLPPLPPLHPERLAGRRVIAEVHARTATCLHPGIPEALRGRYAALAHPVMIDHWRRLGVTTLELLPLAQRHDEPRLTALGLTNHWGYSPLAFLAAEPRYALGPDADAELRAALHALRQAGFEVVLDVVFNHTAELDAAGPLLAWRGLAARRYYRHDAQGALADWSGCGNSLNLAEPMVLRLVLDALRHWMTHFGVSGFRFDLATTLGRGRDGDFDAHHAFFTALRTDPLLTRALLIAEPWDLGPQGHRAGQFPPGWLEWNDAARDAIRAYWLAPQDRRATRAELAQRLAGSHERFGRQGRAPTEGVNYVTAHDGFTLRDLVSFDRRHNAANGESGRDGHADNLSWNAGIEGETADAAVRARRARLQRALLATLVLARGTPMLLAGDEIGHSQRGNNNAYCQDNATTWLAWPQADAALLAFLQRALRLRAATPLLRGATWLTGRANASGLPDVVWALPDGKAPAVADWHAHQARALRVTWAGDDGLQLMLLTNPHDHAVAFAWPAGDWTLWLDGRAPADSPTEATALDGLRWLPAHTLQLWGSRAPPLEETPS
ncbi:MAG: glycogen debranching enzyme GlgX [Proteobacteria bacterium]|nr:glycogen debranching enzyme GlgX [Pseudomonadota bacterium]